ncbi:MAG: tyrosine--tRNA ligase [Candidatus Moranbacteria bacterium CG10_big_fil_rev_8_21_14_0_10_35_21]|nr:MAG: tyrosine--tRNA ligase [Candidatus Moranbacteria bacterium CG10_big_fil_rev_8_21_14_0_10_35_21]
MEKDLEKRIDEILTRGVAEVIDKENLKKKLLAGEKIRVKLGTDPTSPNLHLGRAVVLLKLKDLQDLGHQIVLIVGDFTGVIGDTSDKESERPMLEVEVVKKNLATYKDQAGKILDMEKVEFHYNSEWLSKLGYAEIGEHADQFSLAEFSARKNIKKRLKEGKRISLREVLYPLMQGYDSVAIKAGLELGGTDQRFNLLAGRELQKHFKQDVQNILMVNLIEGTDGRKMSSSWGNTINIMDELNDMFGKVMSMPDDLIIKYFVHCTRIPMEMVAQKEAEMKSNALNPRDAKMELAFEITKIYHGEAKAQEAKEYFVNTFSEKKTPENISEIKIEKDEIKLSEFLVLAKVADSISDARRKIEQGGVEINGEKISDYKIVLNKDNSGNIIKSGKINFIKIVF